MLLYHGSDVAIERPDVSLNTGNADLGKGFYLTDDREAAFQRASSRARLTGASQGLVSVYEFDEEGLPWVIVGRDGGDALPAGGRAEFALTFDGGPEGLAEWISYIASCRAGWTAFDGLGEPALVRAWLANMEVELACTGMIEPAEVVPLLDPGALIVQYCFRSQEAADRLLRFREALEAEA